MSAADPLFDGNLTKENSQPDWAEIDTNHLKSGQALSCDIFDRNTVILKKGTYILDTTRFIGYNGCGR